jgi:hypothetical protein
MPTITRKEFSKEEARVVGMGLGIDWRHSPFHLEQFRIGMGVELEHGRRDGETDVTHDDPVLTGKIALAHLRELPDYYTRLLQMEVETEGSSVGRTGRNDPK